jgi:hypothetical protein
MVCIYDLRLPQTFQYFCYRTLIFTCRWFASNGITNRIVGADGEVALIVEILTGIAAGLFIIEMIGTTIIISREGFVGGYELALLLLPIPVSLILTGPGIKTTILTVM